ncbi:autotransporter outer membrane beta-barrel domain-containing protein [Luteibacter jiangsuensis]|uniref:Autotransporter outer membrane beta-barrel domain-containing protein n=1 Tax=Luteibacter jiangsuensis TaxID=637577 RepID=A0ABX0PY78_9GAMM|nr:autotransporter outer membrane beta-barrel domain-containing protein [Luteibacter jiangsuensis]NID03428.1 autotransporter outer membrane beta-barrel domain-containing protein [Luteibacter jiangsuensis]
MTSQHHAEHRAAALPAIIASLLLAAPAAVLAGNVEGPGAVHIVRNGDPIEAWGVGDRGTLIVDGGTTLSILATSNGVVQLNGAATGPVTLRNGAKGTIAGSNISDTLGRGLIIQLASNSPGTETPPSAVVTGSNVSGGASGILMSGGGTLSIDQSSSVSGTAANSAGLQFSYGTVNVAGKSQITGVRSGVIVTTDNRNNDMGATLTVDDSSIIGQNGSGILVDSQTLLQPSIAMITLANGATVTGGNGIAIETAFNTSTGRGDEATVNVSASTIRGDMVSRGGRFDLNATDGAILEGRILGLNAVAFDKASVWNITGDSDVRTLSLSGASLAFQPRSDGDHSTLTVAGDLSGTGGNLALNTVMNAGGAVANQQTDRLLIEGNVTTTGTTLIEVTATGAGANTDNNQNGQVDAHEGISIIQVGGTSRADAFALRGGYVAAGPYQYTLHAFGPGQTDPAQNLLPSGDLNWDYRLGNRFVCENECEPENPEDGGGGDGENPNPDRPPPEDGRNAVVPQVPSYLSAPAALLTYGDMMTDGLHQRLGDIRQGTSHDPVGGEVFMRYLGGQLRYSSNRSFRNYGYDFDQQINALQLGGSLIALDHDNGTLRAGWAADHGTTRVTPKAADGNSRAKYRANGVSAWATWQSGNGFWVDGVVGAIRYRGDVGTDLRGADVGRIRANGWTTSVEAGMPFALGHEWTVEPRFQVKHQSLNFRDFRDGDGLDVRLGTAKQTSATLGGRLSRTANPVFMPYASVDLTHTSNGDPSVDVSSEEWNAADRFRSGRVGNGYRVSAGAVSQLGKRVQVYGEANYRHAIGGYGMRGFAGNLGVRVTF